MKIVSINIIYSVCKHPTTFNTTLFIVTSNIVQYLLFLMLISITLPLSGATAHQF